MQAICDFVHNHIRFDYMQARSTRTAFETFHERVGVCRDFAHLALTFCRCLNIPARYVNGHLGDIGVPVVDPMDFSAWIEVFLDGEWHTFDPRNNVPRIGRIVVARGRDAADIPLINSFGPHVLKGVSRLDLRSVPVVGKRPDDDTVKESLRRVQPFFDLPHKQVHRRSALWRTQTDCPLIGHSASDSRGSYVFKWR